ncbi:pyridoxal-5'-phosphate-dependent protein [Campylobacter pinnipediorum subsp. pinnipediorum]|uniref:pyridoxal-5'-phosphate-dependent protein n=1 Tax=Campylobacter pinnipediorum TaxID=1965231 RepID=UPI000994934F|nr:pyridoxal-5'-phosphate-dependent protein [Campylobacter pinnipediorum]OPA79566.1 pyridoxal-5'-phosphate-dependent protein [Campylobacter pinnipediorum subsp. pinnipediorum]
MSAKKFESKDIKSLIDLEIAVIKRYYQHAKEVNSFSLIYFELPDPIYWYEEIFERILRNTDAVVNEGNHFIAILYATNKNGASKLLAGIQEFLNEEPIDLVVSYPNDGKDTKAILNKIQDEIIDNYGISLECLKIEEPIDIFEL